MSVLISYAGLNRAPVVRRCQVRGELEDNHMEDLREIAETFRRFAEFECPELSRLYETLSRGIADDPEVLAIATKRRAGQPAPNIFFAAVHSLLIKRPSHPAASFYPDLAACDIPADDPYDAFRSFCLDEQDRIIDMISVRRVQTNVVRRSSLMLPAFLRAMDRLDDEQVVLVEVGASAGLNLFWDRYGYDYGDGLCWGDRASPVQLKTAALGERRPLLPERTFNLAGRIGVDLNPVDIRDDDAVSWLRALVWPERGDEAELLQRAIELACSNPPRLIAGDAMDVLPGVFDSLPPHVVPFIFHSHTLNQFPADARERFVELVDCYGSNRDLAMISLESRQSQNNSELDLTTYIDGVRTWEHLAQCDSHGYRIKWLVG